MMGKLRCGTIKQWFGRFVEELRQTQRDKGEMPQTMSDAPALRPRRPAQAGARMH
jgi:hypothetical protein